MLELERLPAQRSLLDEILDGQHAVRGADEMEDGQRTGRPLGFTPRRGE
jgi:hypothetical protein